MFDFKFDWCKEMESGYKTIDEQHKVLFRIGRDIEQLVTIGSDHVEPDKLLEIICELREYVAYHFYYEENLMIKNNYSNYEEHKRMHDSFKEHILHIDNQRLEAQPQQVLSELKVYLQGWLFEHIIKVDHVMCNEMIQQIIKN